MARLTAEKVGSLTVLDLRKELKKAGLDSKGNKAVLVERLKGHVETTGNTETEKEEEEKKTEPVAAPVVPAVAEAENGKKDEEPKETESAEKKETEKSTEEDNNPLSEARMKRRAERFGLPWPREEGAKRPKLSAKGGIKKKENAISAFVLTSDEINQREARAKRFATTATEETNGTTTASK